MIKHHPSHDMLVKFVNAELPVSLSAAVSIHAQMCAVCQQHIQTITESFANHCFESDTELHATPIDLMSCEEESMIDFITEDESFTVERINKPVEIKLKHSTYQLPRAITNIELADWLHIGKLSRARFKLDEGNIRSSLLEIQPGGGVPQHTHNGFELTLLLAGNFSDEMGSYEPGDFILLDGVHQHQPVTENGCLCFTVVSDSLHFTQGINKLLNPIGNLIY